MKKFLLTLLFSVLMATSVAAQGVVPRGGGGSSTVDFGSTTGSGIINANGETASIALSGFGAVGVVVTGTWTGTLTFEASVDGVTFSTIEVLPSNASTAVLTTTANGSWSSSVGGFHTFRVKATAWTSGDAEVALTASLAEARKPAGELTVNDVGVTSIAAGDNNIGNVDVASSALPTGAATAVKQPALGTAGTASTDVITVQGIASMTPLTTAATQSGTWNITNVSGTVSLPTGASTLAEQQTQTTHLADVVTSVELLAGVVSGGDGVNISAWNGAAPAATNPVPVRFTDGAAFVNLASDQTLDAAISTQGPLMVGRGSSTAPTAMSANNDATAFWVDLNGRPQVNVAHINGVAPSMGNGATGTGVQRVTEATDSQLSTDVAAIKTAVQLIDDDQTGGTPSAVASAASTNSTNVKASAGRLLGMYLVNTTATVYYIRFYNLASAPTCSSATGYVFSMPIPASTTGAGFSMPFPSGGLAFATGISYCITGGASSTDNTNAATGIFGVLSYK